MSTRINFDYNSKPLGRMLNGVTSQIEAVRNQVATLKRSLDSMAEGASYGQVETELGIETGLGQEVYNIVSSLHAEFTSSAFDVVARLYKG